MTDPAVAAAQKIWERHEPPYRSDDLIAAAREALKPIRALHDDWSRIDAQGCSISHREIFDRLAPLIFTTEELER